MKILILAGDGEYGSDASMRVVADWFAEELGAEVETHISDVLQDFDDFPQSRFGNLKGLRDADLLAVYTRFRRIPDDEMSEIASFIGRGGNVLGLRTSTHAFHYPDGSQWAGWNDGFGRDVLGSPWVDHHGHTSTTQVSRLPSQEAHPVLAGVPNEFVSPSWLYRVRLEPDCTPLLWGDPIDPETAPTPGPFAWTRERGAQRVVYTNMGHPDDFQLPAVHRFLINAARWCGGARRA